MPIDLVELPMPIALRAAAPISDEELELFSSRNQPYRIERTREGEITIMTPVGGTGGTNEMWVSYELMAWSEADGSGVAFSPNVGFSLADGSCLSPDASWVSLRRWESLTPEQQARFPRLCPEFLIEMRSETDSRRVLETKMQRWMENGAELAWLIDPLEGSATIYSADEGERHLDRPEIVEGTGPVAGFVLRATRLWRPR